MVYELVVMSIFPFALISAGVSDLFTMTIPNKICIALVLAFFVLAPFAGLGWYEVGTHVAACFLVFSVSLAFFVKGWIGGGDAKLMSATALWLGFEHLLSYILISAVAGGALTLLILFARKIPLPVILCQYGWITRLHDQKQGIPYGLALAYAGLVIYPATHWLLNA